MSVTLYPGQAHRCNLDRPNCAGLYVGVVRQCDECYTWYVIKTGDWGEYWSKVRWYHRKANRLINDYYGRTRK